MKTNIKLFTLVLSVTMIISACSEDALDLQPLDALSADNVFNDLALIRAYVDASYSGIPNINNGNRMGTDALTDIYHYKYPTNVGVGLYVEATMDAVTGETTSRNTWGNSYASLRHINTFFERVGNSTLPANELEPLRGEMHFLRAFYHFELLKYYGGIPIITKIFAIDEESFDLPRNSIEEVVDFIAAELDNAIPLLPDEAAPSRASKAGAMAIKGRTLLYAASPLFNQSGDISKWNAAATANKAVMDLSTYPMSALYAPIFMDAPIDGEVIFAREYNKELDQGTWSGSNTMLWPNGYQGWALLSPTQEFINMFEMTNGELPFMPDGITVNPASGFDPQDPYINRDPRFYDIVLYNGAFFKGRDVEYFIGYTDDGDGNPLDAGGNARTEAAFPLSGMDTHLGPVYNWEPPLTNYLFKKITDPSKPPTATGPDPVEFTPDIKYRKTESFLNYAEAQIALGNEAEARNAINTVRARASVNMPPITATGADLVEAYRRERAVELSLESHRFMDIRRWMIAENTMGRPAIGINIERLSTGQIVYHYGSKIALTSQIERWDDKLYWFPIPDREVKASNNVLTQNPGY